MEKITVENLEERSRKKTDKGLGFQVQLKEESYRKCRNKVFAKSLKLEDVLGKARLEPTEEILVEIQNLRDSLDGLLAEFYVVKDELVLLYREGESLDRIENVNNELSELDAKTSAVRKAVTRFMKTDESVKSGSRKTKTSSVKSKSKILSDVKSRSSLSSSVKFMMKLAEAEVQQKQNQVEKKYLAERKLLIEEQAKIAEQQARIKIREAEIENHERTEQVNARVSVMKKYVESEQSSSSSEADSILASIRQDTLDDKIERMRSLSVAGDENQKTRVDHVDVGGGKSHGPGPAENQSQYQLCQHQKLQQCQQTLQQCQIDGKAEKEMELRSRDQREVGGIGRDSSYRGGAQPWTPSTCGEPQWYDYYPEEVQIPRRIPHPTPMSKVVTDDQLSLTSGMKNQANFDPPDANANFASVMLQYMKQQEAPEVDLEVFSNKALDYHPWMTRFEEVVEQKVSSGSGRLNRLIKFTQPPAQDMVKAFMYEPEEVRYQHAKEALELEYGSAYLVAVEYAKEIRDLAVVRSDADGPKLLQLYLFVQKMRLCCDRNSSIKAELSTQENIRALTKKLPYKLQGRFNVLATRKWKNTGYGPAIEEFAKFLKEESDCANNPTFSRSAMQDSEDVPSRDDRHDSRDNRGWKSRPKKKVTATSVKEPPQPVEKKIEPKPDFKPVDNTDKRPPCKMCEKRNHKLEKCYKFLELSNQDREKFVQSHGVCFGCLEDISETHIARTCKNRQRCEKCGSGHPTVLCRRAEEQNGKPEPNNQHPKITQATTVIGESESDCRVALSVAMVEVATVENPEKSEVVYCFQDSLANGCFIVESVRQKICEKETESVSLSLTTMMGENSVQSKPVRGLVIKSLDGKRSLKLPVTFSRQEMPVDHSDICDPNVVENWPHLAHLKSKLPKLDQNIPIGLIVGADCPRALEPYRFVRGEDRSSPFAVETMFGWTVCGPLDGTDGSIRRKINCTKPVFVSENTHAVIIKDDKSRDEELSKMLEKMYRSDFVEPNGHPKSQEDFRFVEMMEDGTKFEDGHFTLPIPVRDKTKLMPDNYSQARSCAESVRRRLLKPGNENLKNQYVKAMSNLVDKGYARIVPKDRLSVGSGKKLYLLYHDVKHRRKSKIRIVFNCSKEIDGVSLNSQVMSGPATYLTSSIIGVLLRFRQHGEAAFMADIQEMFLQARVPEEDRRYLRFLWWPDADFTVAPVEMEMCSHLFGCASSPACASYALRRTAEDHEVEFSQEAVSTMLRNFYVDDVLKSMDSKSRAKEIAYELYRLCALGGFNLTKFAATDPEILNLIPEDNRAEIQSQNVMTFVDKSLEDPEAVERALGVVWDIGNDTLGFQIQFKGRPATRRGLLSCISSIWDVMGLAAPFLLKGRRILQKLTRCGYSWDEVLPEEVLEPFQKWIESLRAIENLKLVRSFKPADFGSLASAQIHCMSDASDIGYGVGVYVRLQNSEGRVAVNLAMGKSRVVPLDGETIPRSELVAATMAAELGAIVLEELEYENLRCFLWTDSTVVLSWMKNVVKRFKPFVANRIRKIKKLSDFSQWSHVSSEDNCGDDASRGLNAEKVTVDHRWFTGPKFLYEEDWTKDQENVPEVAEDDPELKQEPVKCSATNCEAKLSGTRKSLDKFSNWMSLKKAVASLQAKLHQYKSKEVTEVNVQRLEEAQSTIVKFVQAEHFAKEIQCVESEKPVSETSVLAKLDPFLDDSGVLRVGGRIENSDVDENLKHPVILPKFDTVTDLIVRSCHEKVAHGGRQSTMNQIRNEGFWIIQANSKVRHVIQKCVTCKRGRGKFGTQKMADLPQDRIEQSPPFTFVGVDMFGPFIVKDGRKESKRYGALFCDLVSRAVHLEVVGSMDTDTFINALRRFIARRGNIRLLRSDNGSNFVGADNELKRAYQEIDFGRVKSYLLTQNCDLEIGFEWKYNTPTSSHHGGAWERMIRSCRNILNALLVKHPAHLTSESLQTLLVEVEGIVNSRPLTMDTSDPDNPMPLSPIQLLTQKTKVVLPPNGHFGDDASLYSRKQWKRVQHLTNEFWTRYRSEYLAELQMRNKWRNPQRNFRVGDVVILKDDSLHRNDWPMAVVCEAYSDKKGYVRSVKVRVGRQELKSKITYYERPISKIVLLLESENQSVLWKCYSLCGEFGQADELLRDYESEVKSYLPIMMNEVCQLKDKVETNVTHEEMLRYLLDCESLRRKRLRILVYRTLLEILYSESRWFDLQTTLMDAKDSGVDLPKYFLQHHVLALKSVLKSEELGLDNLLVAELSAWADASSDS